MMTRGVSQLNIAFRLASARHVPILVFEPSRYERQRHPAPAVGALERDERKYAAVLRLASCSKLRELISRISFSFSNVGIVCDVRLRPLIGIKGRSCKSPIVSFTK